MAQLRAAWNGRCSAMLVCVQGRVWKATAVFVWRSASAATAFMIPDHDIMPIIA
ncbi:hypothetical protein [Sphingobium yanoikuyae]|uniref:hypothetical protein n=1 Tax=Sphingobium yanoikuyae TaxID=13690 RepID=UPI0035C77D5A